MKLFVIIFLLLLYCGSSQGQDQQIKSSGKMKEIFQDYSGGVTTEFQTLKHQSINIGFGMIHPTEHCDPIGRGFIINNEIVFKNAKKDLIYSPQISAFCSLIYFYGGLKFSYYTNFKDGGNFIISPEAGLGYFFIFLTYGRNINITNNSLIPVNKNNVSLKLIMPLEMLGLY